MNQAGTQFDPKEASTDIRDDACVLMLYNDNVNTFDFVMVFYLILTIYPV